MTDTYPESIDCTYKIREGTQYIAGAGYYDGFHVKTSDNREGFFDTKEECHDFAKYNEDNR